MISSIDGVLLTLFKDFIWIPMMALMGYTWNEQNKKITAVKEHAAEETNALRREIDRERDVGAKLFEKLEEHARRSEDRHVELLTALHVGLAGKVDK